MGVRKLQRDATTGRIKRNTATGKYRQNNTGVCCCNPCYCSTDKSTVFANSTFLVTLSGFVAPTGCLSAEYADIYNNVAVSCSWQFTAFDVNHSYCVHKTVIPGGFTTCSGYVDIPVTIDQWLGFNCLCAGYGSSNCLHSINQSLRVSVFYHWLAGSGASVAVSAQMFNNSDTSIGNSILGGIPSQQTIFYSGLKPLACNGSVTFSPADNSALWYRSWFSSVDNLGRRTNIFVPPAGNTWGGSITVADVAC